MTSPPSPHPQTQSDRDAGHDLRRVGQLNAVIADLQRRLADMVEQRDAALARLDQAGLL